MKSFSLTAYFAAINAPGYQLEGTIQDHWRHQGYADDAVTINDRAKIVSALETVYGSLIGTRIFPSVRGAMPSWAVGRTTRRLDHSVDRVVPVNAEAMIKTISSHIPLETRVNISDFCIRTGQNVLDFNLLARIIEKLDYYAALNKSMELRATSQEGHVKTLEQFNAQLLLSDQRAA